MMLMRFPFLAFATVVILKKKLNQIQSGLKTAVVHNTDPSDFRQGKSGQTIPFSNASQLQHKSTPVKRQ